jgi:hypothetical protein
MVRPDRGRGPGRTVRSDRGRGPCRVVRSDHGRGPGRVVRSDRGRGPGRVVRSDRGRGPGRVVRSDRGRGPGRVVRSDRGARAGRGDEDQQEPEQHGPHRHPVGLKAGALVGPLRGTTLGPSAGVDEVALTAATADCHGPAAGDAGARAPRHTCLRWRGCLGPPRHACLGSPRHACLRSPRRGWLRSSGLSVRRSNGSCGLAPGRASRIIDAGAGGGSHSWTIRDTPREGAGGAGSWASRSTPRTAFRSIGLGESGAGHSRASRNTPLRWGGGRRPRTSRRVLGSGSLLPLMIAPECLRRHRDTGLAHSTVLFLGLTGLADGLAPKERRYAIAIRPNNLGPPASCRPVKPGWRRGIQLLRRRKPNACADGNVWCFIRNLRT